MVQSKTQRHEADKDHRENLKLYITVGSALAIVPLAAMAIREATVGEPLMALLLCFGLAFVIANLVLARHATFTLWPARFATLFILLLIVHGIYDDAADVRLVWPLVMPPILLFIYDRAEGLAWAGLLLLPCLVFVAMPDRWGAPLPDGRAFEFVLAYLASVMFAFAFQTIYSRNRAASRERAAALKREEERFKDFAETGSDWLYEIDTDHRLTYVSSNMLEQLGQDPGTVIGRSIEELLEVLVEDDKGEAPQVARALRDGLAVTDAQFALRLGRRVVTINVSMHPMFDESGELAGYRGVASDLSEVVAQEEELREKDRVLYRAQKMEAVGQLTSGLAHDFNNLLTVVSGNLDLVSMRGGLDADTLNNVESAKAATGRAAELTAKLLAFAKRQPLSPQVMDLGAHLDSMTDLLQRTLGERVELRVNKRSELWFCRVDTAQFESAVLNLAINARDAMPGGGSLVFTVSNEAFAGDDDLAAGDYVRVLVEDTGEGISDSIREFVFDPFFSTKPQGEGSGLGLSMVYGFVRQSHGDVRILDSGDGGTRMVLYFPRTAPDVQHAQAPVDAARRLDGHRRVLVLEDEDSVRELLATMLTAMDCGVTAVATLAESRAQLAASDWDLLISDIVLARSESGLELVKELRSQGSKLPILLISGYAEPISDESFVLDEQTLLLSKPFGMADLTAAMEAVAQAGSES